MKGDHVEVFFASASPVGDLQRRSKKFVETSADGLRAVPTADDREAPHGLRRLRRKDLPKVGGLFGTSVAALTSEGADDLLRKVLVARRQAVLEEVARHEAVLRKLGWKP